MFISSPHAKLTRDLVTLARFIRIYCDGHHRGHSRGAADLRFLDVNELTGRRFELCTACNKLLAHAFHKRIHCPMDPKPVCKHCDDHCYNVEYRRQIRRVMRYAGWRAVIRGRLDLLWHMIF